MPGGFKSAKAKANKRNSASRWASADEMNDLELESMVELVIEAHGNVALVHALNTPCYSHPR